MLNALLIGSDPSTLAACSSHFARDGILLSSAECKDALIDAIRAKDAKAVLLDLTLAKSDGLEALRQVRATDDLKALPVFVLGKGPMVSQVAAAFQRGDTKVLEKDRTAPAELARAVRQAMSASLAPSDLPLPAPLDLVQVTTTAADRLSKIARELYRGSGKDQQAKALQEMKEEAEALARKATTQATALLSSFAAALARLFSALALDPHKLNVSSLRTVSHAIDFLHQLGPVLADREVEHAPLRILVVDDEAICRRTLQLALRNSETIVEVFESGADALAALNRATFDVVFTDVMMPAMDGFGLASEARKLPQHAKTPIIFLTTLSDFDTRSKSIMNGVCDLIAKPFTVSEIVIKSFTFGFKHRLSALLSEAQIAPAAIAASNAVSDPPAPSLPTATPEPTPNTTPDAPAITPSASTLEQLNSLRGTPHRNTNLVGLAGRISNTESKPSGNGQQSLLSSALEALSSSKSQPERNGSSGTEAEAPILQSSAPQVTSTANETPTPDADSAVSSGAPLSFVEPAANDQASDGPLDPKQSARTKPNQDRTDAEAADSYSAAIKGRLEKELADYAVRAQEWDRDQKAFEELLKSEGEARQRTNAELTLALQERTQAGAQVQELTVQAAKLREELAARKQALELYEHRQSELRAQIETLAGELKEAQSRWREAQAREQQTKAQPNQPLPISSSAPSNQEAEAAPEAANAKLTSLRSQLQTETAQRQRLTAKVRELELAKGELERQRDAAAARDQLWSQSVQSLKAELAQARAASRELAELRQALEQQLAEQRRTDDRLQLRVRELERAKAELGAQAAAAAERDPIWEKTIASLQLELKEARESVQNRIKEHVEREAHLADELAALQLETQALQESVSERQEQLEHEKNQRKAAQQLTVELTQIRSVLETELGDRQRAQESLQRQLAEAREASRSERERLQLEQRKLENRLAEIQAAEIRSLAAHKRELAAFRYAVLDHARTQAQVAAQSAPLRRQGSDRLREVTNSLVNTPLSGVQRQLVNALRAALDADVHSQTPVATRMVEPFVPQEESFKLSELAEDAFQVIRSAAEKAHVTLQTNVIGATGQLLRGDAPHLYQLLTLLATSIAQLDGTKSLDVSLSLNAGLAGIAEANLRLIATSESNPVELCRRLAELADRSASLQLNGLAEAEAGLAVACQLAQAIANTPSFNVTEERGLLVEVAIPLRTVR